LLLDKSGNLVIVDRGNNRVRVYDSASQIVTTIAGGYIGDGGPGTSSSVNLPQGIAFDRGGNLYVTESAGHRVRKIATNGTISTFAGTGISGYTGDGGPATAATLYGPAAVAVDRNRNVYIADQFGFTLRKVDSNGIITSSPANGSFYALLGLATDAAGNLYGADPYLCVIWKITPSGAVSVFAGDGTNFQCGYNGDNIPATQAWLNGPNDVAFDSAGHLYIADGSNNRIRIIGGNGKINTFAGDGTCAFSGDGGPASAAEICLPYSVAADTNGNLYIGDTGNGRVRKVDSTQTIETIAGTGSFYGYNGNGLPALQTNIDFVYDLAINPSGVIYWSDYDEYRVRKAQ